MGINFEGPKRPVIKRSDVWGPPSEPQGRCSRCHRSFPISELQEYYISPTERVWYCPKCSFVKRFREKIAGRV